jgi:hypothetical protein
MTRINFRRAQVEDFEKMVELQNRNLVSFLKENERGDGFLSTAFTAEQFQEMNKSIGVAVAYDDEKLCGYLCCSTIEFNKKFPFPAAAIKNCDQVFYKEKPINSYNCFMANPLCIDKNYRGEGVIIELCNKALDFIPQHYELALSFIADANQRSLSASKKVGMQPIEKFSSAGNDFWIVVRDLRTCPKSLN